MKYLRERKGVRYEAIARGYYDRTGELRVEEYDEVSISPIGQIAGASEKPQPDMLIDDCDFCSRIASMQDDRSSHDYRHIEGRVLYGGFFRSQWGHFLMNTTSRLWPLFTGAADDIDHILFFSDTLSDYTPAGNYREFLELAGLLDKVIIVCEPVRVEHLIVPEIAFEQSRYYSREAMAVFEAVKKAVTPTPGAERADKILLTRSALPTAGVDEININKIDELFSRNGYLIVSPEKLMLSRLINLMKGARSIASLSGSTAHNFVFADPKSEFIIVERTAVNNIFQIGISLMSGSNPTLIDAYRLPKIAPSTGRLFLYGATDQLERFIADLGWHGHSFDSGFKARRRELRQFMKRYLRQSGHATGIEGWEIDDMGAVAEAYVESYTYYKPWLDRQLPLLAADYFSPRCIIRTLRHKLHPSKS